MKDIDRRQFLTWASASLASGALACGRAEGLPTPGAKRKKNIFVVMMDELRAVPPYEAAFFRQQLRNKLQGRRFFEDNGVCFDNHYVASCACVPSRASIFTGHYPSVHGVRQTDGFAKPAHDPAMSWLPEGFPTLGHCFQAMDYQTYYVGKWHISHEDIVEDGRTVRQPNAYRRADRLAPHGFHGWVGPEPHGAAPADMGLARDDGYLTQATELLDHIRQDGRPSLMVLSLVNPHDIVLFEPLYTLPAWRNVFTRVLPGYAPLGDPDFWQSLPEVPAAPTEHDAFEGRPTALRSYRDTYQKMYTTVAENHQRAYHSPEGRRDLRRFYHYLVEQADQKVSRFIEALDARGLLEDAYVVFTSDHGELLTAHGGLNQKWHNAYDETIRVPFSIVGDDLEPRRIQSLTSHIDLLPTLIGLAGGDPNAVQERVRTSQPRFAHLPNLPGVDHSRALRREDQPSMKRAVYFYSEDHIADGEFNVSGYDRVTRALAGETDLSAADFGPEARYAPVAEPASVEAMVFWDAQGTKSKYVRFYDNESPSPAAENTQPQFELYRWDSAEGQMEQGNLLQTPQHSDATLNEELSALRRQYRGEKAVK